MAENMTSHRFVPMREGIWLPRVAGPAAIAAAAGNDTCSHAHPPSFGSEPHQYCLDCGLVRVTGDGRGRTLAFFRDLTGRLKRHGTGGTTLADGASTPTRPASRITQVQRRLMVQALESSELFTDHDGSHIHFQIKEYINIVRRFAPDISREEILSLCEEQGAFAVRSRRRRGDHGR